MTLHFRPWRRLPPSGRPLTTTRYGELRDYFSPLRDLCNRGPTSVSVRGYTEYKPAAGSSVFDYAERAIVIDPVQGGPGPTGCLIYTSSPADQNDAYLVLHPIGPTSGTPVACDFRFEITVTDTAGTGLPPVAPNEWRFGVGGFFTIIDGFYNEDHAGAGNSGAAFAGPTAPATNPDPGLGHENKDESVDAGAGAAVFPTAAAVPPPVHPWRWQYRLRRRASNVQLVDFFDRPPGRAIWDDEGWTLRHTVDRSVIPGPDNDFPPRPNSIPLPDDVWAFVAAYASPVVHDIRLYCHTFWPAETLI